MVDVTVAPATHDRKLRDRHAGTRHDHLGTILGNTLLLVLRADDEARDVVQEDQWRPSLQPRPQTHASPAEAMLRRDSRSGHWVAATVRCAALRSIDVAAASTERIGAHVLVFAGARLALSPGRPHSPIKWYVCGLGLSLCERTTHAVSDQGIDRVLGVGVGTACLAAVLYEMCSLDRRLREEHAVVADDPHWVAVEVRKPTHERGACAAPSGDSE